MRFSSAATRRSSLRTAEPPVEPVRSVRCSFACSVDSGCGQRTSVRSSTLTAANLPRRTRIRTASGVIPSRSAAWANVRCSRGSFAVRSGCSEEPPLMVAASSPTRGSGARGRLKHEPGHRGPGTCGKGRVLGEGAGKGSALAARATGAPSGDTGTPRGWAGTSLGGDADDRGGKGEPDRRGPSRPGSGSGDNRARPERAAFGSVRSVGAARRGRRG